ncbi:MAG: DNA topoisomerase IB, partial [Verrucomicrobia bacterium]|nr:DNA topoisomerase IB [Verrucomicrobiota bacterium]
MAENDDTVEDFSEMQDPRASAAAAGLRYVSDQRPGITRIRNGSNFVYRDQSGNEITDSDELIRIKSLAIPPAWENVWICPRENGHLQATGRDTRNRKQYRYHPKWRSVRDEVKFGHVLAFAEALPNIRAATEKDLAAPGLPRNKILATVVRLLEVSLIRIGNEEYAKENHSFGLSTMRNRHAQVNGSTIQFAFRGKSGVKHSIKVSDRRLARIVQKCQDLPGQHLFQYLDEEGNPKEIESEDVNAYLESISGQQFTAKDFRTWAATVLAAIALEKLEEVDSKSAAKKNVVAAIEAVSGMLGNTASICRKCYVHPSIINSYLEGTLVTNLRQRADAEIAQNIENFKPVEAAVLALLRDELAAKPG